MTKFIPKEIHENVNVDKRDPLTTFFKAGLGLVLASFIVFISLVAVSEAMIRFMPDTLNKGLAKIYRFRIKTPDALEGERLKLQNLLNKLVDPEELGHEPFRLDILDTPIKNAFAFPGRTIVLTTELLKELDNENEVLMILGHELGHYKNQDHLQSLSRGVILLGITQVLSVGGAGGASQIVMGSTGLYNLKHSREQETLADEYGLSLLFRFYGHVRGAVETFEHLRQDNEGLSSIEGILSTHPLTDNRIDDLRKHISAKRYPYSDDHDVLEYVFIDNPESKKDDDLDGKENLKTTTSEATLK